MALTRHITHRSATVGIDLVHCRPHDHVCGAEECSPVNSLAFPLRGMFLKHHSSRERVVADACHAIFFRADEPYRVSHPVAGGDECLVIEPSRDTMHDVLGAEQFAHTHVVLDARLVAAARILRHRLVGRMASSLEAEETALGLLAGTTAANPPAPAPARARQRDMVEATKIMLAAQPGEAWLLNTLAQRVHSSPFYLARTFQRLAGMPLHRYLLHARMAQALVQVLDTSRELSEIALELGFSNHSHFTYTFRRMLGVTPASLRKQGKIPTAARALAS
jgi:AraC family transcriptional regulator